MMKLFPGKKHKSASKQKIKPGLSALVTGGASGLGLALCLALAEKGVFVTVVIFRRRKDKRLLRLLVVSSKRSFLDKCRLPLGIKLFVSTGYSDSDLIKASESLKRLASELLLKS